MLQTMLHRTLSVRFPLPVWTLLEKYAQQERSNVGRIVVLAVEDYLRRKNVTLEEPKSEPKA